MRVQRQMAATYVVDERERECASPWADAGGLASRATRRNRIGGDRLTSRPDALRPIRRLALQFEWKFDVFLKIAPGQKIGILEDHRDFGVRLDDRIAVKADAAAA